MKELDNKVVVITGAASGMGKAMAELFASEGAKLVLSDVNVNKLDEVVKSINDNSGNAVGVVANVSLESDVAKMIDEATRSFGRLDVLINNAGILDDFLPVGNVTNEKWEGVLGVNVNGPMYACRLAIPIMLKQGNGVIINVSSIGGFCGSRAGVAYTTSKHALIGMTKNIAYHYADKGIRCNTIAPGGVATNIGEGMKPDELGYAKLSLGLNTAVRTGEPKEIAEIALFLASNRSSLMNGAVVVADAGWTAY